MRFSDLCLCYPRRKCDPAVPFLQDLYGISSGTTTEFAISDKQSEQPAKSSKRKLASLEKAIMSIWPRLRKRQQSVEKSSKPNPYAGRGLDKFALVYAELAEQRETVAAQTGTSLSLVRFSAGARSKWIPVFVTPDRSKVISERSFNSRASEIVNSDTISSAEASGREISIRTPGGAVAGGLSLSFRPISFTPARTEHGGTGTNYGALEQSIEGKASNRFLLEKNEKWPKIAKQASLVAATLAALWIGKVAAMAATVTVALAFGVLLKKQHGWNLRENKGEQPSGKAAEIAPRETDLGLNTKIQHEHESELEPFTAANVSAESEFMSQASDEVPSREIVESIAAPGSHQSGQKGYGDGKKRSRFKSKFIHKHASKNEPISAPSSPIRASGANFFSSTPSSPAKARSSLAPNSFPVPPNHGPREKQLKLASHDTPRQKSPLRVSSLSSSAHRTKRPAGVGATSTAVGLCIILLGLLGGRWFAVFILACWWYAVPQVRQLAGDQRPSIRAHTDTEKLAQNSNKSLDSSKLDLHSNEYKKRVIMEGLLDRNRKATS